MPCTNAPMKKLLAACMVAGFGIMPLQGWAETQIKFGFEMFKGDNPEYNAVSRFKEYVESKSNGEISVRLFPGGQLGTAREMTEMVQQGSLEMSLPSDGAFAGFYEPIQAWSIPYLFRSAPVAWQVMQSDFGRGMLDDITRKTGMEALAFSENGFRSFATTGKQIIEPSDMEGLKIRTMESPVYMEMVKALGASPTPISGAEAVMALKQGVVDGLESPPAVHYTGGAGDVVDYFTLNEHVLGLHIVIANGDWFNSLSASQQQIVTDGSKLLAATENVQKTEGDWKYSKLLEEEKGVEVHVSTPEEKELFKEKTQDPVRKYIVSQVGEEFVNEIMKAVDEAEQSMYN
ncbi:TRAP transporter substrate-binding protein [Modicisalibacter radicis]|uniref:TRAP transporter substrate-binding protein n=1 Tax=Halomonas sp. EAR18 TaxID=2518972 RepID=UPI001B34A277|nr:DctP family TRAP transporter solute-binding subunit [Halomonas sp. EAR18]